MHLEVINAGVLTATALIGALALLVAASARALKAGSDLTAQLNTFKKNT